MSDPFTWCRIPRELSVGQRARFVLCVLLFSKAKVVAADEFLTGLDRVTARAVAWAIGRLVRKLNKHLIVSTSIDDIAADLLPDIIVRIGWDGAPLVEHPTWQTSGCTLHSEISFVDGTMQDWQRMKPLHYAAGDPGTWHSIHCIRHAGTPHPVAVAVLSYPSLASAARNLVTDGEYNCRGDRQTAQRLNREVLLLSRIVVAPEFRCAGLATKLVRSIVDRTTARWIECSTSMGRYTRFLENAGFREVPQATGPSEAALHAWATMARVPEHLPLDIAAFAVWVDQQSVRDRREARRIIWKHYHQFVVHRRTSAPAPKKVPPHHDPHWPAAFEFAAKRLHERPSYWIIGPLQPAVTMA